MVQDHLSVEILLKVEKEDSIYHDCNIIMRALNFNDHIEILEEGSQHKIKVKDDKHIFEFSIVTELPKRIFSIIVSTTIMDEVNQDKLSAVLDSLTNVIREIKMTIAGNFKNCSYEILWDDVGMYYATMAFPMIVKIENLMRKLITKFMLVPVGMEFFDNIPNDINVRENKDNDSGFLHNIDFIELSKYIFTARPLKSTENLIKIIDRLDENKLPLDVNLLDYQSNSYWNRYFKDILGNIDGDIIKKQWEELYKLRCKIAHSKFLKKDEYERTIDLYENLKAIFHSALDKLGNISLSTESKESISQDIISEIDGDSWSDKLYGVIVSHFKDEFTLKDIYAFEPVFKAHYPENNTIQASIRRNLQKLRNNGKIIFLDNGRYKIKRDATVEI